MGIFDKLFDGLEMREEVTALRERVQELELERASLRRELDAVGPANIADTTLLHRVKSLEATLRRVIEIAKRGQNEYCDPESQAEIRTAVAILENK